MMLSTDADRVCGTDDGTVSDVRITDRRRYRPHSCDTGAAGPRSRFRNDARLPVPGVAARAAPTPTGQRTVVHSIADCYPAGVSTRRLDELVRHLRHGGKPTSFLDYRSEHLAAGCAVGVALAHATC